MSETLPPLAERPTASEAQGPVPELTRVLVHRLLVERVARELDSLARVRAAGEKPTAAPDLVELVASGNARAFARLGGVWLDRPTVVAAEAEPSPAELGLLAVLAAARDSGDARWAGVDLPSQPARLTEVADRVGSVDALDRDLARGWLWHLVAGLEPRERDEAFAGWWREVAGEAPVPIGSHAATWYADEPPVDRWVVECARALVDVFFNDVATPPGGWPVRTLEDLPWPLEDDDDPRALETAGRRWFLAALDLLEHDAYPGALELVESLVRQRRSSRFYS